MDSFFDKIKKQLKRMTEAEKDPLLTEIEKKLTEDLNRYEEELAEKSKKDKYYWGDIVTKNESNI